VTDYHTDECVWFVPVVIASVGDGALDPDHRDSAYHLEELAGAPLYEWDQPIDRPADSAGRVIEPIMGHRSREGVALERSLMAARQGLTTVPADA
jgi:hypothetical protein